MEYKPREMKDFATGEYEPDNKQNNLPFQYGMIRNTDGLFVKFLLQVTICSVCPAQGGSVQYPFKNICDE